MSSGIGTLGHPYLRGGLSVIFGFLTLAVPGLTLTALVILWGAFALVEGVSLALAVATKAPGTSEHRGILALQALAGIAAGIVTFSWPLITALVLLLLIAAWAIMAGVSEIASAVRLRRILRYYWVHALVGVLSIGAGIGLVLAPVAGALAITWLIGWWAVVLGGMWLASAWTERRGRQVSARQVPAPVQAT